MVEITELTNLVDKIRGDHGNNIPGHLDRVLSIYAELGQRIDADIETLIDCIRMAVENSKALSRETAAQSGFSFPPKHQKRPKVIGNKDLAFST